MSRQTLIKQIQRDLEKQNQKNTEIVVFGRIWTSYALVFLFIHWQTNLDKGN